MTAVHLPPDRPHARFSPSSAEAWTRCPAASFMASNAPPQPDTIFTRAGKLAHRIAELSWVSCQDACKYDHWQAEGVTPEMVAGVQMWLNMLRPLDSNHSAWVEYRLNHPEWVDFWGTADWVQFPTAGENVLRIADYKNGVQPVDIATSRQMEAYMLLADEEAKVRRQVKDPTWTRSAIIVQPSGFGMDKAQTRVFSSRDMAELSGFFQHAISTARVDRFCPGEHCKRCKGLAVCPEICGQMQHAVEAVDKEKPANVAAMDNRQLSFVLSVKESVEALFDRVEEEVQARLAKGQDVPGFKRVLTAGGHRKWIDPDAVARKLMDLGTDPYEKSVKSPAQIEKLLGKDGWDCFGMFEMVSRSEGHIVVAPSTDKRREIPPDSTPADDFAEVAAQPPMAQEANPDEF